MLRGKHDTADPTRYQLRLSIAMTLRDLANDINTQNPQR
jgi:hypothetical protein